MKPATIGFCNVVSIECPTTGTVSSDPSFSGLAPSSAAIPTSTATSPAASKAQIASLGPGTFTVAESDERPSVLSLVAISDVPRQTERTQPQDTERWESLRVSA